jgi:N-acetylglucosamine kinase-like BadF-type ATPase
LFGIDAGGSSTSVRAWTGDRWSGPSVNPTSVGQDASDRCLAELFSRIRAHTAKFAGNAARPAIWLASAAVSPATAAGEIQRCAEAARRTGLRAELVISNDVTPLVLDAPAGTGHVVVVCGTGSCFLGTDGSSAPVRVGGCEYLGSDEGSAFDLGLFGLRAAVRGLDGRGPRTALSGLFTAHAGMPVPELARELAREPFPKSVVAALAPLVLRAWLDADPVASGLVGAAIGELAAGARAARDAAAIGPGWQLSAIGGIVTGCSGFFGRLAAAAEGLGAGPVRLIEDPAEVMLTALAGLAVTDPLTLSDPRIDRDTWYLDLASPDPASPDPASTAAGRTERLASGHHA